MLRFYYGSASAGIYRTVYSYMMIRVLLTLGTESQAENTFGWETSLLRVYRVFKGHTNLLFAPYTYQVLTARS